MPTEMASKYDTLSTLKWWAQPRSVHWEHFKWLRENDPVSWHGPPEALGLGKRLQEAHECRREQSLVNANRR